MACPRIIGPQTWFVAALAALIAVPGTDLCAVGHHRGRDCPPTAGAPELPPATRGDIESAATSGPLPSTSTDSKEKQLYRLLSVPDAQAAALQFAPMADALARERRSLADAHPCCEKKWVRCLLPCHCDDRANVLKAAILEHTEQDSRNRSAGVAMELFFSIAELEAKDDIAILARSALAVAHDQAKDLADKGFKLPIELASLERQRLEVEADQARLQGALNELNGRLKSMIGQDAMPDSERIWPSADWAIPPSSIDAAAAIQIALQQRAELQLLRRVNCDLDAKTLLVVRAFLKTVNGAMGSSPKSNSPIIHVFEMVCALFSGHSSERSQRSGQLEQLLADRERAVASEVRQALSAMIMNARLMELDRQRAQSWQVRVQEMRDRVARGAATFLELLHAETEWLKARTALIGDIMAWHRARAQLTTAQGGWTNGRCSPE